MAKRRLKKPSPTPFLRWNKRSRRGVPAKSETNHRNANRSSVRKGLLSVHDGGPFCLAVILQLRGCWVDIVCEVNLGGYAKFHLIRFSAFHRKAENHLPQCSSFARSGDCGQLPKPFPEKGTRLCLRHDRWDVLTIHRPKRSGELSKHRMRSKFFCALEAETKRHPPCRSVRGNPASAPVCAPFKKQSEGVSQ